MKQIGKSALELLFFIAMVVTMAVALFSCSAQKRFERFVRLHPDLVRSDTVVILDTLISEGSRADTLVSLQSIIHSRDTIVIHNHKLTEKIYYHRDSLFFEGECATDTVVKEIKFPVVKYLPENAQENYIKYGIIAFIFLILGMFLHSLFNKK